jgi:hypothetical protein
MATDHKDFFQGGLKLDIRIKNLGKCDGFLGVDIHIQDDGTWLLYQTRLIKKTLEHYWMDESLGKKVPIDPGLWNSIEIERSQKTIDSELPAFWRFENQAIIFSSLKVSKYMLHSLYTFIRKLCVELRQVADCIIDIWSHHSAYVC